MSALGPLGPLVFLPILLSGTHNTCFGGVIQQLILNCSHFYLGYMLFVYLQKCIPYLIYA